MPQRASVVVVGAGVVGASVAYHLAARGWRDVLLLDRGDRVGQGSTGAATGGFRAQFATSVNVQLSLLSREKLRRFSEDTGVDPGFETAGYLWLASTEDELAMLRSARGVQQAAGLSEAVELTSEDVAALNPAVNTDEVVGATFCPTDGFLRPLRILEGYLEAARRLGVWIEWGRQVVGFRRLADGRIGAVETSRGTVQADAVVVAAGPWAALVAELADVPLPVVPLRRQVAATTPCELLPETMPMTIFVTDGFHLRVRDGRVLLLWPTPGGDDPWDATVEPDWLEAVAAKARRRVPVLREVAIDREASWAGLYEMSPDRKAIVGPAPGCPNLFLVNGSSGHGVMHAPALGQLLAELMTDGRATTLDLHPLRPSRFAEGGTDVTRELL